MVNNDSKLATPADLKGKTVAVPTLNGPGNLSTDAILKAAGVDTKTDGAKYVAMPFPNMAQALKTKQIDAAWLVEPFISQVQKETGARKLVDTMSGPTADLPIAGWGGTSDWVKTNPKTLAAFQRAIAKAQQIAATDPKAVQQVIPTYTQIKPDVASVITLGSYPTTLNEARLQRVADLMLEFGMLHKAVQAKPMIAGQTGA
jgi:NitT/TauT family transport system substrate-binding protein